MYKVKPVKRAHVKAGLSPGSLIYTGQHQDEDCRVSAMQYDAGACQEQVVEDLDLLTSLRRAPETLWVDIEGIHEVTVLETLGRTFKLHPLLLEDIMNTDHRPKLEDYGDYLFLVLKALEHDRESGELKIEQISLVLGHNFVISLREGKGELFEPVRLRLRNGKGNLRKMGPDYLAYALIDVVVDNYFVLLEGIGEEIDSVEEELISRPTPRTLLKINSLKKEMLYVRKSLWPLREVINLLDRGESDLISDAVDRYLKDVYDHMVQVLDTVETYRDMLSGLLDIYLSSVSNKINEVMKVLTIIATIFIPLTFIVGVYGMNFRNMPELDLSWGYGAVWLVMLSIAAAMVMYFRRRKWF